MDSTITPSPFGRPGSDVAAMKAAYAYEHFGIPGRDDSVAIRSLEYPDYRYGTEFDEAGYGFGMGRGRLISPSGDLNQELAPDAFNPSFNPMNNAKLSPSAFNSANFSSSFILPRFASSSNFSSNSTFDSTGVAVISPALASRAEEACWSRAPTNLQNKLPIPTQEPSPLPSRTVSPPGPAYFDNPVYDFYGSSVISVQPLPKSSKSELIPIRATPASPSAFDPTILGLPLPPADASKNVTGLYSTSGFDLVGVLARVAARPNPQITIGPVDLSCSFVVVDAQAYNQPIIYCSDTFTKLTGYSNTEIIGKNCRFLQSPTGMVTKGERRMYSDSNAAHHMRTHIDMGRESQSSLINYRKDGSPFINLVTIIPISWDDDATIAYFVGLQVDLVDQPAAILEKMRNGTYVVNYSLINSSVMAPPQPPSFVDMTDELWIGATLPGIDKPSSDEETLQESKEATGKILAALGTKKDVTPGDEVSRKLFNRMLLDNCDDFVHVLSLKGSLLYASASVSSILEYGPTELIGTSLASICHPSDIVSVLRELKDAGAVSQPTIHLLYRVRRKKSGYMWMEASGKLHFEHGKGKKCVILVGRPREVYSMSWNTLERMGGMGDSEYWSKQYWSKLSLNGMHLYTTPTVKNILGYSPEEMVGTCLAQLMVAEDVGALRQALEQASAGLAVTLRHSMRSRNGLIEVLTNFYASSDENEGKKNDLPLTLITQTVIYSEEAQKRAAARAQARNSATRRIAPSPPPPRVSNASAVPSTNTIDSAELSTPSLSSGSSSSRSIAPPPPVGFKSLPHPSATSDNIFDELGTTRGTSWQYELANIRMENQNLRKEKEKLEQERARRFHQLTTGQHHREQVMAGPSNGLPPPRIIIPLPIATGPPRTGCANCGRNDTAPTRAGPTGRSTLCDFCSERWIAKNQNVRLGPPIQQIPLHPHPPPQQPSLGRPPPSFTK